MNDTTAEEIRTALQAQNESTESCAKNLCEIASARRSSSASSSTS